MPSVPMAEICIELLLSPLAYNLIDLIAHSLRLLFLNTNTTSSSTHILTTLGKPTPSYQVFSAK